MKNNLRGIKSILRKLSLHLKKIKDICKGLLLAIKTMLRGERCGTVTKENENVLVMGNGPSLKEIDIQAFTDNYKIACVNFFANQEVFFEIKPQYYIIIDPVFFAINSTNDVRIKKLFYNLEKVDWKLTIISQQGCKLPIKNNNITYEHISYYGFYSEYASAFLNKLYRRNLITCGGQNVMVSAIYYFVLKRYRNIYVAGLDMSEFKGYSIDKNNHVLLETKHFYGSDYIDYTEKGVIKLGEFYIYLGYYVEMFRQFYHVAQFAKSQNVNIYNLTLNSFVDVFEKINCAEINHCDFENTEK